MLEKIKYDFPASIVVFLVALPLCLGVALASGAPLLSGLISGIIGGFIFGCGWAIAGACPAPMFILLGAGHTVFIVYLIAAMTGTFVYGLLRKRIPH